MTAQIISFAEKREAIRSRRAVEFLLDSVSLAGLIYLIDFALLALIVGTSFYLCLGGYASLF